jgi:Tfp pilus assembly protein PilZ
MDERRRSQRISVFLEVKEIDGQPLDDAYVLNFSETGVKIETPRQYAPGKQLQVIFYLPDKVTAISRKGQVVWVSPDNNKPGNFLVGLELADEWELGRLMPD